MSSTEETTTGTTTTSSTSQTSQPAMIPGINIHDAMAILSARSSHNETNGDGSNNSHSASDACPCCQGDVSESVKKMGQTIDLLAPSNSDTDAPNQETDDAALQALKESRESRLQKIQSELNAMTNTELLQAILQVQHDRVAIYREFESGLVTVLETGNVTSYPDSCSKATASFAVASDTVRSIQSVLDQRSQSEWVKLIQQLQASEKKKLQLTAAHHLERIRLSDQKAVGDARTVALLQKGADTLQRQIHECVETINDTIDEIRCILVDG
eukprot:Nitzschia sp. Nitz4//scaffold113_size70149//37333//38242//NITZ4_005951-RA/size70149-augustus-gene-0.94-mRNA-1//-1//CDS//3329533344//6376//frame0